MSCRPLVRTLRWRHTRRASMWRERCRATSSRGASRWSPICRAPRPARSSVTSCARCCGAIIEARTMSGNGGADALIRQRHVLYVEGYDPQGAEGYHNLFSRSFKRFLKNWPLTAKIGDLQIDSDDLAHWAVDTAGPNWQFAPRYDFLRQEQMIRANMAEPMWRQVPRALRWMLNY